jgi:magnesium-transporting ATPase (P-type)
MSQQAGDEKTRRLFRAVLGLGALAILAAVLVELWRRRRPKGPVEEESVTQPTIRPALRGLTEAEAEARRLEGVDNVVRFQPSRSPWDIWRDNGFTIFNLSLFGIAGIQFLLGQPRDAWFSLAVSALNVGLNVGRELFIRKRLQGLEQATRPQATAMRDGQARSIDPDQIVRGDVLVVGPGDQFLADGELLSEGPIVVDQAMLTGAGGRITERAGEPVYAGSFCVSGRAAYLAQKIGDERLVATLTADAEPAQKTLTPLERIVQRILRVMLLVVLALIGVLLSKYFRLDAVVGVDTDAFVSAASVIFSLAPAGLFFMIFLTYASGTMDLARRGALVHRARSIESLAHATVLCIAQGSILTSMHVKVEPLDVPENGSRPTGSRLHRILGDYARSSSARSQAVQAMADAFPGERRAVREEAPFLAVYGWSAVTFDEDDLRGVFALGEAHVLEGHLVPAQPEQPVEVENERLRPAGLRARLPAWGRLLRRRSNESPEENAISAVSGQDKREAAKPDAVPAAEENGASPNRFQRWLARVGRAVRREQTPADEPATTEEAAEEITYLFAYHPRPVPLHDHAGQPQLIHELIPLCRLHYTEQLRPETIETVRTFARRGVALKLFSPGAPGRIIALLKQAGLYPEGDRLRGTISGPELAGLSPEALTQAADENTIFGYVTADQAGRLVDVLQEQGESVVVVGDGPNDLPAMQHANLSIAGQSSSQAALGVADIVLLEDSPQALLRVLDKGQRIVNGLLDVLKLYLAQLSYLVFLIFVVAGTGLGFPYVSKQGSLIGILTLTLPSVGLSLWATPGALSTTRLGRRLARFVVPAALTMSLAALAVYVIFYDRSGQVSYAQLALTHMLVFSGLALVILVRPPLRLRVTDDGRSGDRRPLVLVLALLALFFFLASFPLGYELFLLTHLRGVSDYLVVVLALLSWVGAVLIVWWLLALKRPKWPPGIERGPGQGSRAVAPPDRAP